MGWGMGNGIGWPNASASLGGPPYALVITNCAGDTIVYIYSASPVFEPGIYVYTNPELTMPFGSESGIFWNTWDGLPISGGYEIGPSGDVKPSFGTCA